MIQQDNDDDEDNSQTVERSSVSSGPPSPQCSPHQVPIFFRNVYCRAFAQSSLQVGRRGRRRSPKATTTPEDEAATPQRERKKKLNRKRISAVRTEKTLDNDDSSGQDNADGNDSDEAKADASVSYVPQKCR